MSTVIHNVPPGMSPPSVIQFNAANVPVVQMTISSKTLSEQQLADYALNFIRIKLFTIPGLSSPAPFGGKTRQIMIYVDPAKLSAKGLPVSAVLNALQNSNVIVPAGTARLGGHEYNVSLNSSPEAVEEFANIPIGVVDGVPVLIGDVGIGDGFLCRAEQYRSCRRQARHLSGHPQAFRRVHPGGGGRRPRYAAPDPGGGAQGHGAAGSISTSRCSCAPPSPT